MLQVILVSFTIGLILSAWSTSLFFILAFILIWEFLVYLISDQFDPKERALIIIFSILGWIFGRILLGLTDLDNQEVFQPLRRRRCFMI